MKVKQIQQYLFIGVLMLLAFVRIFLHQLNDYYFKHQIIGSKLNSVALWGWRVDIFMSVIIILFLVLNFKNAILNFKDKSMYGKISDIIISVCLIVMSVVLMVHAIQGMMILNGGVR